MNTRNIRFRSNRVRDILSLYHEELDPLYGPGEVAAFGEMLFEAFLGWNRIKLLTSKDHTVNQSDLLRFHWALEDLRKQRPIQHIIGYTDFCGCRINVSPDVLIPRPETEEMAEWIINRGGQQKSILDLCTGSGCIATALKKNFPEATVTAVDLSAAALAIAHQNAQNNNAEVTFLQADILNPVFNFHFSIFNLIVSNPPYVMEKERAQMQRNVLDYDPALALFVPDDDPLRFYRAIADIAKNSLASDGLLAVEINEVLADETCDVIKAVGLEPTLHTDFRGKPRWISAVWNP